MQTNFLPSTKSPINKLPNNPTLNNTPSLSNYHKKRERLRKGNDFNYPQLTSAGVASSRGLIPCRENSWPFSSIFHRAPYSHESQAREEPNPNFCVKNLISDRPIPKGHPSLPPPPLFTPHSRQTSANNATKRPFIIHDRPSPLAWFTERPLLPSPTTLVDHHPTPQFLPPCTPPLRHKSRAERILRSTTSWKEL